ncbi:MAG: hypothetical protein KBT47_09015, partial [Armatimonadetes bacterium]|nr:hypothetical protein [Candidatus Hippobium faecium]
NVWQNFILPRMTVFLAQNAYGYGCPWECPHSEAKPYNPDAYPMAQLHTDTHFGMTVPLRSPNGPDVAIAVGKAIKKVYENINELKL